MAAKKEYTVKAALVTVPSSDGKVHYFYAGAVLPDGLDQSTLDRLDEDGYISTGDDGTVTPVLGSSPPELAAHQTVPSNPTLPPGRKRG